MSSQRNMQIHLSIALGLCVVCAPMSLHATETALLLLFVGLVFSAELMNSALEACVDLCSPQPHPLAKRAKDAAAAAVLVLALTAVVVFVVLFARQWPVLQSAVQSAVQGEGLLGVLPMALLGCSWALATAEWLWWRHRRAAFFFRLLAIALWLGSWFFIENPNLSFWGLGLFLLLISRCRIKTHALQSSPGES